MLSSTNWPLAKHMFGDPGMPEPPRVFSHEILDPRQNLQMLASTANHTNKRFSPSSTSGVGCRSEPIVLASVNDVVLSLQEQLEELQQLNSDLTTKNLELQQSLEKLSGEKEQLNSTLEKKQQVILELRQKENGVVYMLDLAMRRLTQ